MNTTLKSRWLVDAGLLFLFIATFFLDITGVPLHQWIGVAVGVSVVYHLISHWAWVKSVTLRFFGKTSSRSRIYYLLDASLLMGLLTIIGTGLVISTWLNLSIVSYTAWHFIHVTASLITLLAIVLKVGLHWRWIASVAKNIFTRPSLEPRGATGMVSTSTGKLVGRREFNRVMTVVGISSIAAAIQGVSSLQWEESSTASSSSDTSNTSKLSISLLNGSQTSSAKSGTVRCNKRCAYPGHCRRYADSNNNGRCDLGEST